MLDKIFSKSAYFVKRNLPTILTIIGTAGLIGTSVITAKASVKVNDLYKKATDEKGDSLTYLEKIDIAIPVYIPVFLVGSATAGCFWGANILNRKQQASLAAAYAFINKSYNAYQRKVKDIYGEDAHYQIADSIVKEKCENVVISSEFAGRSYTTSEDEEIFEQKMLFYDEFSERYFESTMRQVMNAEYHLNRNFQIYDYAYLNEFYEMLGIEQLPPSEKFEYLGWSVRLMLEDGLSPWIEFIHRKVELDTGLICRVIELPYKPVLESRFNLN